MRAEFDQDGLDQGYARVTLSREPGDAVFYEEGDSLALGRGGGSTMEFLCRAGGGKWSGQAEGLALKSEQQGDSVVFFLPPAYVDALEDGSYAVCLLGQDGKEKARTIMLAFDVSWSGLDDIAVPMDFSGER